MVKKFVKASLRGWNTAVSNPDDTLLSVAKYENEQYKDPAREKHILEQSIPLIKPTGARSIGSMEYIPWNDSVRQLQNAGILESNFDVTKAYTTKFLDQ